MWQFIRWVMKLNEIKKEEKERTENPHEKEHQLNERHDLTYLLWCYRHFISFSFSIFA